MLAVTVRGVKQVVKVRMLPTEEQAAALEATLRGCNDAVSWLSTAMHAERVHRKHEAQKRFYIELKQQFGLSAQRAIRVTARWRTDMRRCAPISTPATTAKRVGQAEN